MNVISLSVIYERSRVFGDGFGDWEDDSEDVGHSVPHRRTQPINTSIFSDGFTFTFLIVEEGMHTEHTADQIKRYRDDPNRRPARGASIAASCRTLAGLTFSLRFLPLIIIVIGVWRMAARTSPLVHHAFCFLASFTILR